MEPVVAYRFWQKLLECMGQQLSTFNSHSASILVTYYGSKQMIIHVSFLVLINVGLIKIALQFSSNVSGK